MPVWLDYHERGLQALAPTLRVIAPPVGDIWIGEMRDAATLELLGGGVVLERKTLLDLEASVIDGRYEEQRGRMLAYALAHNVAVAYVVEGETAGFRGRRFTGESIVKLIAQMQLHHRIPVFQTSSMHETVQLALTIDGEWAKRGFSPFHAAMGGAGGATTPVAASYTKSVSRDTRESFLLGVLTQCRGISEALARAIAARVASMEGLMRATEGELAAVSAAERKRKVGAAVAARLHGLLHGTATAPRPEATPVTLDRAG